MRQWLPTQGLVSKKRIQATYEFVLVANKSISGIPNISVIMLKTWLDIIHSLES